MRMDIRYLACLLALLLAASLLPSASAQASLGAIVKPTYDLEQGFRFQPLYEMGEAASSVYDVGMYSRIKPTYDLEQGYRFRDLYDIGSYQSNPPYNSIATSPA